MDLLHYQDILPLNELDLIGSPDYAEKTYGLNWQNRCIKGFVQGLPALCQRIYKILATEKNAFPIYSESYGLALDDLRGQDHALVESELKRRITESLEGDPGVYAVTDFVFTREQTGLAVNFSVWASPVESQTIEWRFASL